MLRHRQQPLHGTAVRAEFAAVDLALSRFRDDSELTALNRAAGTDRVVRVSWRLREAIAIMDRARRLTDGRFDPTFAETLERLGEHGAPLDVGAATPPSPLDESLLERPRAVRAPTRPLDTGGIGKGLALRWAARRALPHLPGDAGLLLEAGGDIIAAGTAPASGWLVGIEDPLAGPEPDADPLAVVALSDGRGCDLVRPHSPLDCPGRHARPPSPGSADRGARPHRAPRGERRGT